MDIEKMQKHIADLDYALSMQVLRPEEHILLSTARDRFSRYLEAAQKQQAVEALKRRTWQEAERRTPGPFLGEGRLRIPRFEYPRKFSHAGPEVILPNELETPPTSEIRDFVPNTSYGDRISATPDQLMWLREKNRRGQRRI
ncbi:MAG: hypothetical protein JW883_05275 [Deltaproteobacteria bacterium]|nr:hypothetical protein [Deltaproteobacteria bacterium]